MKYYVTAVIVLLILAMIGWGLTRTWREQIQADALVGQTSDAGNIKRTVEIWGDEWLGYMVFRSPQFKQILAKDGLRAKFTIEPDFEKRLRGLEDGRCDFAVMTLDSYLTNGTKTRWPGVVLFVIDESFGGDAVVAHGTVKNLDSLNKKGVEGRFVGYSPSEFLLRAQVTHFKLNALRKNIERFRTNDAQAAFKDLKSGRADFAVLWEPFVRQALNEISGAKVLIDTRSAQGIVIDIAVAGRKLIAREPEVAQTVTLAYFTALHELLANPRELRKLAERDSGEGAAEADAMLGGIKFASLDDNLTHWMGGSGSKVPGLVESFNQIGDILTDHEVYVSVPQNDLYSIMNRSVIHEVAQNRHGVRSVGVAQRQSTAHYPALSREEWGKWQSNVRGTLINEPITFRPGSTSIPDGFQEVLHEAVPKLSHYPSYRIVVEAHVSASGQPKLDHQLSESRARAVKDFLVGECGVAEERILAIGRGSSEPPRRLSGESQRAYERRARRAKIALVSR